MAITERHSRTCRSDGRCLPHTPRLPASSIYSHFTWAGGDTGFYSVFTSVCPCCVSSRRQQQQCRSDAGELGVLHRLTAKGTWGACLLYNLVSPSLKRYPPPHIFIPNLDPMSLLPFFLPQGAPLLPPHSLMETNQREGNLCFALLVLPIPQAWAVTLWYCGR